MAKLLLVPLLILCVSAASGQGASEIPKDSNIILTCRPQKPLSHTHTTGTLNEATPYISILDRYTPTVVVQKVLVQ